MGHRARHGDQEVGRLVACWRSSRHTIDEQRMGIEPTWDGVTVEALYFMFRRRGFVQQVPDAVCTLVRVSIPSDRRRRPVEFRQISDPRWGVIRGVVQTSELVCSASRNFDAVESSAAGCEASQTHLAYSSRVRVLILLKSDDNCQLMSLSTNDRRALVAVARAHPPPPPPRLCDNSTL